MTGRALVLEYRDTVTCSICQEDIDADQFREDQRYLEPVPLLAVYNGGVSRNHVFHRSCILSWIMEHTSKGRASFPDCPSCRTEIRTLCGINCQFTETITTDPTDLNQFITIRAQIPADQKAVLREQARVSRAQRAKQWKAQLPQARELSCKQTAGPEDECERQMEYLAGGPRPAKVLPGAEFQGSNMNNVERRRQQEDFEIDLQRQAQDILRIHRRGVENQIRADLRRREDENRALRRRQDDQRLWQQRRLVDVDVLEQRRVEDMIFLEDRQANGL